MKKIFSIILVAVMMLSIASVSVNAANVEDLTAGERALLIMQRADVNGDQVYSTDDVSVILKAAAGIIEIENEEFYDIDLDGYVSVRDAQLMLEVVSGVGDLVSDEDALEAFNSILNGVKSEKPGFTRTTTAVIPSMKVTTSGTGISALDVTNMEYNKYVDKLVNTMNTYPFNTVLNDSMKKELEEMKQSAIDLYKPQTETKTVAAGSNSHYTYFPVNNLGWSSKLTVADIKSIDCIVDDGCIVFTITMNDHNYAAGQYPTGTKGFSDRQKLPYGKIFNLPALDEETGEYGPVTVVNSMKLQKGKIVLKADLLTGDIVSVDYSYSYVSSITNNSYNEDGKLSSVMTSVTTANYSESYAMNH